ncbi:MAG: IS1182 family transposase [Candidatus Sumerlaeia bacterium]|nr:IS1182 family transposase [Candidatus Sumerlaeia bacterium]
MGKRVRLLKADRSQLELRPYDLDSLIAKDHRARLLWECLGDLDLSKFEETIESREGESGRPAIDPRILITLWLYATAEGVGSAREIARLCLQHRAYEWIRGKVEVGYHTLSDFRVKHEAAMDSLLTEILGVLTHKGLIELRRVSQDGIRVRANAGQRSYRRRRTLGRCLKEARQHLREVKKQSEDGSLNARQEASRERAALEREQRIKEARAALEDLRKRRAQAGGGNKSKSEPRGSTTDAEAHTMRMADGGYRPAYNVQLAADTGSGLIVGVGVSAVGSDAGLAKPMVEQIERRTGVKPKELLVDGGYPDKKTIDQLDEMGVTLYAPVAVRDEKDPHRARPEDSAAARAWRRRMKSAAAKEIYKERASTIERVNADLRTHRTLDRMPVRGIRKVTCVVLLNAITFNLLWMISKA